MKLFVHFPFYIIAGGEKIMDKLQAEHSTPKEVD
jgi:hypothetical protein